MRGRSHGTIVAAVATLTRTTVPPAAEAGIAAGLWVGSGADARRRLEEGFTFAAVGSDLTHLTAAAAAHLAAARTRR